MNGKGDSPRPKSVPKDVFEKNWENAFGKRKSGKKLKKSRDKKSKTN